MARFGIRNVEAALSILKQDKASLRDRSGAIQTLREQFSHNSVVLECPSSTWEDLFCALEKVFKKEKEAVESHNKSSATAERRIKDIASFIRWLVQRGFHRLNFTPLHRAIDLLRSGLLYDPVTLDCVKALKCLLSFKPHLEHLEAKVWVELIRTSFNVILGDASAKKLLKEDWKTLDEQETRLATSDYEMSDEEESEPTPTNRKRRRHETPRFAPRPGVIPSRFREPQPVSQEQIEFMSLLSILLKHPYPPIIETESFLSSALLSRFLRFLSIYPGDSSLHYDYLQALSSMLSHVALNHRQLVCNFARRAWSGLISMWGPKTQRLKEDLTIVLRILFPYLTLDLDGTPPTIRQAGDEGVDRLWKLLSTAERRGAEGLSLDSLRLHVVLPDEETEHHAFVAKTLRSGWHFDATQALSWVVFELQADCAARLYHLSENVHIATSPIYEGKRSKLEKLEDPITSLLRSIETHRTSTVRAHFMQTLFFFIDRHWSILHRDLRRDVTSKLSQFLSYDDGLVQSWTFICFAAIAHADSLTPPTNSVEVSPQGTLSDDNSLWDTVWAHAMRRSTVPAVCRAACHTAYTLLLHSKILLSPQRVIAEIETLAKDLDVQGPSFPYDSVCDFLILCMKVASHDVRLYRMQLEEKVLSWFMEAWRPGGASKSKMSPHTVEDILKLAANICGIGKRAEVICSMVLPDSPIVDAIKEEQKASVIRDFSLYAKLSSNSGRQEGGPNLVGVEESENPVTGSQREHSDPRDLVQPRGRERRISAFLLKALEEQVQVWESIKEASGHATAERSRSALDLAIVGLFFEASLVVNGTRSNRRVINAACRLLTVVSPTMTDGRWIMEERDLLVSALEPLVLNMDLQEGEPSWETILEAGPYSGIRRDMVKSTGRPTSMQTDRMAESRRELQRVLLKSSDVQDSMTTVLNTIRDVLRQTLESTALETSQPMDIDDHEGFRVGSSDITAKNSPSYSGALRRILRLCVASLAAIPILQSSSESPTRDKFLLDVILEADGQQLLLLAPSFFDWVKQRALNFSVTNLDKVFECLKSQLMGPYQYSHSEGYMMLVIQCLHSTMHLWLQPKVADSRTGTTVRDFCLKMIRRMYGDKMSWRCKDRFLLFLNDYLQLDPTQSIWVPRPGEFKSQTKDANYSEEYLPTYIIPQCLEDPDIRVRFRATVVNARLFDLPSFVGEDPTSKYTLIRDRLCKVLDQYEEMLTRLLCLGNIMVVSSAVRRGPYWHILETCLFTASYNLHVEAVLRGVAANLGLPNLALLFESYASQMAFSIRQNHQDFLRLPPHLLGYRDRRECAEATFHAFTPTNLYTNGALDDVEHGLRLFSRHCQVIQKSTAEGIQDCLDEIIGFQIVAWFDDHAPEDGDDFEGLETLLQERLKQVADVSRHKDLLQQYADGAIATILRTLGDQDYSSTGHISIALAPSGRALKHFRDLTKYRHFSNYTPHQPNLPAYPVATVLNALQWFSTRVPRVDHPATTYHILHRIFAEIERAPLVNEQVRLLNALALWASLHRDDFKDLNVLRTFMNGASTFLLQFDVARAAQSMIEWGFVVLLGAEGAKSFKLTETVIRIACIAYDHSSSRSPDISAMGRDMLKWVEDQVTTLSNRGSLKGQIAQALSAWPSELPEALRAVCGEPTSHEVSGILGDRKISSSKFRLVRRMRDLSEVNEEEGESSFATSDFWRLKECIPTSDQLVLEDVDAFCELLVRKRGHISGLGGEQAISESVRTRHIQGFRKKDENRNSDDGHAPQHAIIVSLLAILDDPLGTHVSVAYNTLRSLISGYGESFITQLPAEYSGELELIRMYPRPHRARPELALKSLLDEESSMEIASDFPRWIQRVAMVVNHAIATSMPFYSPVSIILQSHPDFAEQVLPVLIHTVLRIEESSKKGPTNDTSRHILSEYFTRVLSSDTAAVECRRSIVDTVLHLRHFAKDSRDALSYDKWLTIDYVLLSKNAISCGAYTTALLFLELAVEYHEQSSPPSNNEDLMFEIYSHIDEPDGFYGIKTSNLNEYLIRRFHHEKQWDKAFRFHGAALETRAGDHIDAEGVLYALHSFGFNNLAMSTLHDLPSTDSGIETASMNYQLGWRTDTWDMPDPTDRRNPGVPLYLALRAVHRERDPVVVRDVIHSALFEGMQQLHSLGNENLTEIRQVTQALMCLRQVNYWRSEEVQQRLSSRNTETAEWADFTSLASNFDFTDYETVAAVRVSLLRSVRQKEQREQMGNMVTPFCQSLMEVESCCLLKLSEAARKANQPQVALNSVVRAQKLLGNADVRIGQEYANVLWQMKEPKVSVQYLRELLPSMPQKHDTDRALLLAQLGTWMSEACLDKPASISSEYFEPAVALIDSAQNSSTSSATVYHRFAMFAERQYYAIVRSPDELRAKVFMDRKQEEIKKRTDAFQKMQVSNPEYRKTESDLRKAQRVYADDCQQYTQQTKTRDSFLSQAITMYSQALAASDDFDDDAAIRLCSLWFANFTQTDSDFQSKLSDALERVPSRKFIFLAHQLSARISKDVSNSQNRNQNQSNLQQLVLRMCKEHPFHSLYQVYCLRSDSTGAPATTSRRQSSRHESPSSQVDRAAAANTIFDKLKVDPSTQQRVNDVEKVCKASLEWAQYPIKEWVTKNRNSQDKYDAASFKMTIHSLKNIRVPVVTVSTPIDPTTRYDNCIWIDKFETKFAVAGGINVPKISYCLGSDGGKYRQLYKGEGGDDLRQDAVMEQVFDLVNIVLKHDRETKRRNLSVRRYKVVPLSTQAGILEFVGNTTPLGNWLNPSHKKYRPHDYSGQRVHKAIADKRLKVGNHKPDPITAVYKEVTAHFLPVLRHWFTESHKSPLSWYTMRLNYARSLATNSIVGHILGLGDRHMSNILLDNGTGEVVHIDLGIAFDQGKLLPIPERVPFRLTRDMVDGLGTSGTQGVFQRCAEETLRVLRDGSEVILTVLEVFKYDPLHSWTASELKVKRVYQSSMGGNELNGEALKYAVGIDLIGGTADESAERALTSVRRKLDKSMTVEFTVNELIAEATDVANLANMFVGWQAYC
ncbi:hypothetical protein C8Q75DRAFT_805193 [Abortiporus biennis]|nr:hypothetical protein C8Q75DRAFT_805193 [Abortiporus biennis]